MHDQGLVEHKATVWGTIDQGITTVVPHTAERRYLRRMARGVLRQEKHKLDRGPVEHTTLYHGTRVRLPLRKQR